jgi:hypothetical protein
MEAGLHVVTFSWPDAPGLDRPHRRRHRTSKGARTSVTRRRQIDGSGVDLG